MLLFPPPPCVQYGALTLRPPTFRPLINRTYTLQCNMTHCNFGQPMLRDITSPISSQFPRTSPRSLSCWLFYDFALFFLCNLSNFSIFLAVHFLKVLLLLSQASLGARSSWDCGNYLWPLLNLWQFSGLSHAETPGNALLEKTSK
jgi:hypothetical protein